MNKKPFLKRTIFAPILLGGVTISLAASTVVLSVNLLNNLRDKNLDDNPIPEEFLNLTEDGTILLGFKPEIRPIDLIKSRYNTLKIPKGVKQIDDYAFSFCFDTESCEISKVKFDAPEITKIGQGAFYGCRGITSFEMPDTITSIGAHAFDGCIMLKDVELPSNIEKINDYAFYKCSLIEQLTFPTSLQKVGRQAFAYCTGLHQIDLSQNQKIPTWMLDYNNAFEHAGEEASKEKNVYVFTQFDSADKWSSYLNERQSLPAGAFQIASTRVLPEQYINFDQVNSEILGFVPDFDLSTLQNYDTMILPEAEKIHENAFYDPGNDRGLIYNCNIDLQINCKNIDKQAFKRCGGIRSLTLSQQVETIGQSAFERCGGIQGKLTIPQSVSSIGENAFLSCDSVKQLILEPISSVVVEKDAFTDMLSVEVLDFTAFGQDMSLVDAWVVQPDTTIFNGWSSFGQIILDATSTRKQSFIEDLNEYGLTQVKQPMPHHEDLMCWDFVKKGFETFWTDDLLLGNKRTYLYSLSDEGKKTKNQKNILSVWGNITKICDEAFMNEFVLDATQQCWGVQLFEGLSEIGNRAFANCNALFLDGFFTLPQTLTIIGDQAFMNCTNLRGTFELPSNITTIGSSAFFGCYGLHQSVLQLPEQLQHLGGTAFAGTSVHTIRLGPNIKSIGKLAFVGIDGLLTLDLTACSLEQAQTWNCEPNSFFIPGSGTIFVSSNESEWTSLLQSYGLEGWTVYVR